jgi:hypothetical protein
MTLPAPDTDPTGATSPFPTSAGLTKIVSYILKCFLVEIFCMPIRIATIESESRRQASPLNTAIDQTPQSAPQRPVGTGPHTAVSRVDRLVLPVKLSCRCCTHTRRSR